MGAPEDRIPEDCVWNRDELIKYLGPIRMLIYKNVSRFQLDQFGDGRVQKESMISNVQVDEYRPSWINTKIRSNLLADESQFMQFGIA